MLEKNIRTKPYFDNWNHYEKRLKRRRGSDSEERPTGGGTGGIGIRLRWRVRIMYFVIDLVESSAENTKSEQHSDCYHHGNQAHTHHAYLSATHGEWILRDLGWVFSIWSNKNGRNQVGNRRGGVALQVVMMSGAVTARFVLPLDEYI